ncbi:MAG: efflux RND transporter periplasmic adaptor subunit [Rikenellaceae bacterium]|nr:efflux RND transporter periplasmic adaptor subunit [Rikenellaceae bacterium]
MQRIVLCRVVFIIVIILSGCSNKNEKSGSVSKISVRTFEISETENISFLEYIGVLEEEQAVILSFPLGGTVNFMQASEGKYVKEGDIIARLDVANLQNIHNGALATLEQAQDAVQRLQMLYDNEALPEIQYIEAKTKLEQACAAESIAAKNLNDAVLRAPFSGVIGLCSVEQGENVLPNQMVVRLLRTDNIKVRIPVPEKEISSIPVNAEAVVMVHALDGSLFKGVVVEKGVVADIISHTYDVKISIVDRDTGMLPGMVCKVFVRDTISEEMTVPPKCVHLSDGDNKYVWIVENNIVRKRTVDIGGFSGSGVVVRGLKVGDRIVTEGYQKLFDGAEVDVL